MWRDTPAAALWQSLRWLENTLALPCDALIKTLGIQEQAWAKQMCSPPSRETGKRGLWKVSWVIAL